MQKKNLKLKKFNNINFDIIFITNPSSLHIKTILNLKTIKNCYIFIEKPIDVSLKNYNKFQKFINKKKLKIFVGCNLRFNNAYNKLKKLIKSKKLGKINYSLIKSSMNIAKYHSYENYKKSYTSIKKLGGGICFTNIHEIDLILNLFDKTKLYNSLNAKLSNLKIDVDDYSVSIFKNQYNNNNFVTVLILDHFQINNERYVKIICEKGEIIWDLVKTQILITKDRKAKKIKVTTNYNHMFLNEIKYFLNLVNKKKKIPIEYSETNGFKCLKMALEISKNNIKNLQI